jgi:cell shape-determining protein MreC
MVRLRENEVETYSREFKTLKGAFENMQLNLASVMRENDQLKAALNEYERNNI